MKHTYNKKGELVMTTYSKEEVQQKLKEQIDFYENLFPPFWVYLLAMFVGLILSL